jgi:hypothetical protein
MAAKTIMPLVIIALVLGGAVVGYTLWKNQQGKDPLMALGNGRYEGATQAEHVVETLSLPPLP